jgi:hypothetical protein
MRAGRPCTNLPQPRRAGRDVAPLMGGSVRVRLVALRSDAATEGPRYGEGTAGAGPYRARANPGFRSREIARRRSAELRSHGGLRLTSPGLVDSEGCGAKVKRRAARENGLDRYLL